MLRTYPGNASGKTSPDSPLKKTRPTVEYVMILFVVAVFAFSGCGGGGGGGAAATATPTYTVTYDGNGDTGGSVPVDSTGYEDGETVTVLGNTGSLQKTGYTFSGWCPNASGTGTSYTAGQTFAMGTADVVLYAMWTPVHSVTYAGNSNTSGSAPVDSTYYGDGETVTVLGNSGSLKRTGYAFAGWCLNANGTGTSYSPGQTFTMGSANVTLYAKWAAYSTGVLDTTFDTDGKVTTEVVAGIDVARSVAIQADGRILAAGYSHNGVSYDATVARYDADGSLDTGFDTDGIAITSIGSSSRFLSMSVQDDGKILAAGYALNAGNYDFILARYNTNGSLDTSFGVNGIATTAVGSGASNDYAYSMSMQTDGRIVVAGYTSDGNNLALVRYNTNGSLDTSFDADGKLTTEVVPGNSDYAFAMSIQGDDKIVVAGYTTTGANADFSLVRYNTDGSLDTSFDADGKVTTAIGGADDVASSIFIQDDGKIVVAGYSNNGANNDFALARYNSDGSLDTAFDADGKVTTQVGAGEDVAYALAIQDDGKIVVAGYSDNGVNADFALARYNTDGSLDTTLDTDGVVTTQVGAGEDVAYDLAFQADGKIVAVGSSSNVSDDFALVRYD